MKVEPEISKNFNPSIPSSERRTSLPVEDDRTLDAQQKSGLLSRFRTGFIQKPVELTQREKRLGVDFQEKAEELYELLLDKVEIEIDVRRQARKIASQEPISDEKLQAESEMIKQNSLRRNVVLSDEEALEIARARIVKRRIKSLLESDEDVKPLLSPEEIKTRLLRGELAEVDEAIVAAGDKNLRVLKESKNKLGKLEESIQELSQDPNVREEFEINRKKRLEVLKKARTISKVRERAYEIKIGHDRKTRENYLEGRQYSPGENTVLAYEDQVLKAIDEATNELLTDPEVFEAYRLKYLQKLQEGFKKSRFSETSSRQNYLDQIRHLWVHGEKVLLTGSTGGGKTELLFHAARSLFDTEAERLSGHPNMTNYEIYGKMSGKVVGRDKTVVVFDPGPFTRAVDKDNPLIIDEINVIPNKVVMRMKADFNARPGQKITIQEENGKEHEVGEHFAVGATANVKSEKHPDREEIDPAIVRMFKEIKIQYLPNHELYDIMLASLMDIKGGVKLTLRDVSETLKNFCDAVAWTQKAYNGESIVTNQATGQSLTARGSAGISKPATLEVAVLDPGNAIDMITGWEDARRQGLTLREFLNPKIVSFINGETFPQEDRYYLAEIFALQGFLKGVRVEELNIPGLDQATLDSWNGYDGKRYVPAKDVKRYLSSQIIAKLDPYGVLQKPLSSDISDLLDLEGQEEVEELPMDKSHISQATRASSVSGLNFSGLTVVPDAEGRDVLQALSKKYPSIPDTMPKINRYAEEIREIMTQNKTTIEAGLRKLNEIVEHAADNLHEIESMNASGFIKNIWNYCLNNRSDLTPENAKLLKSVVQKFRIIIITGSSFDIFNQSITDNTSDIYNWLNTIIGNNN